MQAAPFLETLDGYDTKLYLELLERAVEEVMLALRWAGMPLSDKPGSHRTPDALPLFKGIGL